MFYHLRLLQTFLATTSFAALPAGSLSLSANSDALPRGSHAAAQAEFLLSKDWQAHSPRVIWRTEAGPGFGGITLEGDQGFYIDRVDFERDVIRCVSIETGRERWQFSHEVGGRLSYPGSRTQPTVASGRVFAVGGFGDVYCLDADSGKILWQRSLPEDFDAPVPNWGFTQTPLIFDDKLILAPMASTAGLIALQPKTGELLWRSPSVGANSYCSPTLATLGGKTQILFLARSETFNFGKETEAEQNGHLTSIDPENGAVIWQFNDYYNVIPIPNPVQLDANHLVIGGGYEMGTVVLQVERAGDEWATTETARIPEQGSHIAPYIPYEGHVFANFNFNVRTEEAQHGLICMNPTGEVVWQSGANPPLDRGSVLRVGDSLLAMGGNTGTLHLFDLATQAAALRASFQVFDDLKSRDNNIWAPLTFANGKLLARSGKEIVCLELATRNKG